MRLYILKPIKPWEPWYDKTFCTVARARSPDAARKLAAEHSGDEGKEPWLDPARTTCEMLRAEGVSGIICQDTRDA